MMRKKSVKRWLQATVATAILIAVTQAYSETSVLAEPNGYSETIQGYTKNPEDHVTLEPGFGYYNYFMRPLAEQLYLHSTVTAFLPTRLPDSAWQYYGYKSRLTSDGYEILGYRTPELQAVKDALPVPAAQAASAKELQAPHVLFRLKAGQAGSAKLQIPSTASLLLNKDGWDYYTEGEASGQTSQGSSNPQANPLYQMFSGLAKSGAPVAGSKGTVLITGQGTSNVTYAASWTVDGSTFYSFVLTGAAQSDFTSMLTSFRPVINLLDYASVILLPVDKQLNLQIGRDHMFMPYENRFIQLAHKPVVYNGSVFLPLRDIVHVIGGEIQYVSNEGAVYLSQNGWHNELKLNLKTGEVDRSGKKIATLPIRVEAGTTLVPLRFMTEQFGLPIDYNAALKQITVHDRHWAGNYRLLQTSDQADYPVSVLSVGGPSFTYSNSRYSRDGSWNGWSYVQHKPPVGYNSLKYNVADISIALLPGDNELVLQDLQTKQVIMNVPIKADLSPNQIPFRYSGIPYYDGLKTELKLQSSDGIAWPAGYAETNESGYVTIQGKLNGLYFDSLRLSYHVDKVDSKTVTVPVKDGAFSYRFKPEKGPGTYYITLYNPPNSLPKTDMAAIVTFVIVVKS